MTDAEFNVQKRESVEYLGMPYDDARLINGTWYFRSIFGHIGQFANQDVVLRLPHRPESRPLNRVGSGSGDCGDTA